MHLGNRSLIVIFLVVDLLLLNGSLLFVSRLHYGEWFKENELFLLLSGIWTFTYILFLNLSFFDVLDFSKRIKNLLKKFFIHISLGALALVILNLDHISRTLFFGGGLLFLILEFPISYFYTQLISNRKDAPLYKKVLIVGAGKVGRALEAFYLMNPSMGTVIGFIDDSKKSTDKLNILGKLSDFQEVFDSNHFNEVIITIDLAHEEIIRSLVNLAEYNGVRPSVVANYYSLFRRNFEIKNFAGIPIVNIREVPLDYYIQRFWKRLFDIGFSSIALILLMPVLITISIIIKLDSKGPVFYRPIRVGKRGAQIRIYKFRSMRHSLNPNDGTKSTAVNDSRITKVGKFIRKYSLDELPQFINVLNGDMSVVGPRPHRVDLDKRFQQIVPSYMVRQYIKPGITGWAQVNGWRGPTETKYQYIARTLHDLWYIEHWNFALDMYIILLTLFGKNTRKNAF